VVAELVLVRSMRTGVLARVIAVAVVGLIWAAIWWQINLARHANGKEAFLAAESRRFDIFHPRFTGSFVAADIASAIVDMGLLIVVYESVAFGIYKVLSRKKRENDVPKDLTNQSS
jgi:hypothetical protein